MQRHHAARRAVSAFEVSTPCRTLACVGSVCSIARRLGVSRRTIADFCCFPMPAANATGGAVSLELFPHIERDLCSAQPWLVLHKARRQAPALTIHATRIFIACSHAGDSGISPTRSLTPNIIPAQTRHEGSSGFPFLSYQLGRAEASLQAAPMPAGCRVSPVICKLCCCRSVRRSRCGCLGSGCAIALRPFQPHNDPASGSATSAAQRHGQRQTASRAGWQSNMHGWSALILCDIQGPWHRAIGARLCWPTSRRIRRCLYRYTMCKRMVNQVLNRRNQTAP